MVLGLQLLIVGYHMVLMVALSATVTGIGPLVHFLLSRHERRKYLDRQVVLDAVPDLAFVESRGNQLAVRFSLPPSRACVYPICIPNGAHATMAMTGRLHDSLVARGFAVLSYDRLGCGFSDCNAAEKSPTVEETVQDMDNVMSAYIPHNQPWIIIGQSIGSIVGQCYCIEYPHKVAGFLNVDGLPYSFHRKRSLFQKYGYLYWLEKNLVWTGVLRLKTTLLGTTGLNQFASSSFPIQLLVAQSNQANFYRSVWLETSLMMDCCEAADAAWGSHSVLQLSPPDLASLLNQPPTRCGDEADDGSWVDLGMCQCQCQCNPSSQAGSHPSPLSPGDSARASESPPLAKAWRTMVVRVMSARNHDQDPLLRHLYDQAMRDWAAAEQAQHQLWALNGGRDVFPLRSHARIFGAQVC